MRQTTKITNRKRRGFTLIELLVVIAIISILAAILFPVFARARENARRASCMSNGKQIGLGLLMYVQDYDERYPSYVRVGVAGALGPEITRGNTGGIYYAWHQLIHPYIKNTQVFNCPSSTAPATTYTGAYNEDISYGYATQFWRGQLAQGAGLTVSALAIPTITPMVVDATRYIVRADVLTARPADRHLDTFIMVFADGHVKTQRLNDWITSTGFSDSPAGSANYSHLCTDAVWKKWLPVECP